MPHFCRLSLLLFTVSIFISGTAALAQTPAHPASPTVIQAAEYARDPHQAIDEQYTAKIRQYTTEPEFNSPLTDYLPASKTIPTPASVLGDEIRPFVVDVTFNLRRGGRGSPKKIFRKLQLLSILICR